MAGQLTLPALLRRLGRYKYALAVLAVGLLLMLLPTGGDETPEPEQAEPVACGSLESRLEELLSQISGAGAVRVLLTEHVGEEVVYQTDADADRADTVIVEDSERTESGLVRYVAAPGYRGAVVVCQGADSASVRLAIVQAVSCATGLGSDQICVVKMN